MEKKKSIFKKIILGVSACLIALCAVIPFAKLKIDGVYASGADVTVTTYTFHASDLYNFEAFFYHFNLNGYKTCVFNSDISYNDYSKTLTIDPNFQYVDSEGTSSLSYKLCIWATASLSSNIISTPITINRGDATLYFIAKDSASLNQGNYFLMDLYSTQNFNANVYKIKMERSKTTPKHPDGVSYAEFLNIYYYDMNDEYIQFSFFVNKDYQYETRTYYLIGPDDLTDNQVYNQGFNDGYESGVNDGTSSGYTSGYNAGVTEGYNNGYNVGINDSNQYSFYNLFGAVIDAPIRVFSDLFNFNLLGINLLGLITGLFTLAMIILIIKLILGGK